MDEDYSPLPGAFPTVLIKDSIIAGGYFNFFLGRNGARSLESVVAFDALLNSEERSPAPRCHPETRKEALEIVKSWIWNRQGRFKDIMWISGAPGVGKSAICQTICEELAGPCNPIHASFFFTREQGARERATSLPPTVAHQFAVTSIICNWYIWYLLRKDPSILREAFHSQFRKLVVAPASARSYIQNPMVVVIDGLDECNSEEGRVSLLKLVLEAANTKSIRFLIASRPEAEIETFFKDPDVSRRVDHVVLDEETFETRKDIIIFLRSEFARIRRSKPHSIPPPIDGEEWPGDAIIFRLAVYADGQFIYAILAIGFIDSQYSSPSQQLELLLNPPSNDTPFSTLDRLYLQILTRCSPQEQGTTTFALYQKTVKGILRVMVAWPIQLSIPDIATVLGEEVFTVQTIVRGPLRTLFKFNSNDPNSKIAFCHKSLLDCLLDPRRSGDFHVPKNAIDLLYRGILSCPPPSDPSLAFTREQLVAVLHAVLVWPFRDWHHQRLSESHEGYHFTLNLALIADVADRGVRYIIYKGPTSILFKKPVDYPDVHRMFDDSFKQFLLDPNRAGVFHAPENALDLLYLSILSRPPPVDPSWTLTQDQVIEVLHAVLVWPFGGKAHLESVAQLCNIDPRGVKCGILEGPTSVLFARPNIRAIKFFDNSFEKFLSDPDRAGDFSAPKNTLDLLYLRILSHPPPRPPLAFTRGQLIGVIYAVAVWTRRRTKPASTLLDQIALINDLRPDAVRHIIAQEPTSLIFTFTNDNDIRFFNSLVANFLLDPGRVGDFHIPKNALDLLYLRILSQPPPSDPSWTFTPEQLVDVLHVVALRSHGRTSLSLEKIAFISEVDLEAVCNIVDHGPTSLLFETEGDHVQFSDPSFRDFLLHRYWTFSPPSLLSS